MCFQRIKLRGCSLKKTHENENKVDLLANAHKFQVENEQNRLE